MNLYEAIGLLGLEQSIGADYTDYTSKDVEKCFRQLALRHHPDKGGDSSYFQLLHRAKEILLEYQNTGNIAGTAYCRVNDTNSTAVSTSLYEHRTCVRQVLAIHGKREAVIAATDDGLIVVELKKDDNNYYLSGGLERVVSFTTHRDDCSFLCCATGPSDSDGTLYAGAKDGFIHKIDLSTHRLTPWQLPSRGRIVAISAIRDWVAIATADGGIYVFEYENGSSKPTMVWRCPNCTNSGRKFQTISPETILLEEGSSADCLNLWVGGSSSDKVTGKIAMWELNTGEDFYERFDEELFGEYDVYDSETCSCSEESDECVSDDDDESDVPALDVTVQEGPIFSLSKHKHTIAVTSGQYIIVWGYYESAGCSQNGGKKLAKIKTIKTDNKTLYALCINERFIAAAGSGESIMVWDRGLWTMLHCLPLQRSPSGCCLATNCIMTLDWFHEDSGILVSGGYDGVVTMWTVANRLERK